MTPIIQVTDLNKIYATGFTALAQLATRPDDPLATPAGALRAQLLESWPQLAQLEAQLAADTPKAETIPCPA